LRHDHTSALRAFPGIRSVECRISEFARHFALTIDSAGIEACADLLRSFILAGGIVEALNRELTSHLSDPIVSLAINGSTVHSIIDGGNFNISVASVPACRLESVAAQINDFRQDCLVGVCGDGQLELELYKQTRPEPHDVFEKTRRLERAGKTTLRHGDVRFFTAGSDLMHLISSSRACLVTASSGLSSIALSWAYDAESLEPIRAIVADPFVDRIVLSARLIGRFGDQESAVRLMALCSHNAYFVRWRAARELCELDAAKGLDAMRRLISDEHPEVRSAAALFLAQTANA